MATASGVIPPGAPNNHGAASAVIAAWQGGPRAGRVLAVALGSVVLAAAASWFGETSSTVVAALALAVGALTLAALVDAAEHRLPNALVGAAAIPVAGAAALAAFDGRSPAGGAITGAALCGIPLLLTHVASPAGLGFGDVKAATVLGGALGLLTPLIAVAALMLAFAITATAALATGRRAVALGPGLVAGSAVALLTARLIGVRPW